MTLIKKIAASTAALSLLATASFAGQPEAAPMDDMVIHDEASSSSGGFVLPLMLLLVVLAVVANDTDSAPVSPLS